MRRLYFAEAVFGFLAFLTLRPDPAPAATGDPQQKLGAIVFADDFKDRDLAARYLFGVGGYQNSVNTRTLAYANGEHQLYTAGNFLGLGIEPCQVSYGTLKMTARPLPASAKPKVAAAVAALPAGRLTAKQAEAVGKVDYSSCLLASRATVPAVDTLIEFRAKLPTNAGMWSGLWAFDNKLKVELDVAELERKWVGAECYKATMHSPYGTPKRGLTICPKAGDLSKAWHRYGARLTKTEMIAYFDGKEMGRVPILTGFQHANLSLLVTLSVGLAGFPNKPDDLGRMYVDEIRAWALPAQAD